jgi:translation initiation factor IF-3
MRRKEAEHKINNFIRNNRVRLVGDNVVNDEVDIRVALKIAQDLDLDLVEISNNNNNVSICKVVDYQKFLFDKKKKEKEAKKRQKQNQSEIKEIRLTPNTDDHDFNFKLNHAKNFLNNNDKVLVSVFFKGREISYKEQGEIILLRFANELSDFGVVENLPKLEGKRMLMMIRPLKK